MIIIKNDNDINLQSSLWHEIFKDNYETINYFFNNCKNYKCYCLYYNNKLASMCYVIDCIVNDKKSGYVFAVCTKENYQGFGFSTKLLNYLSKLDYTYLWLIPSNDSLISFYNKRGYLKKINFIDNKCIIFNENKDIVKYIEDDYELSEICGFLKEV